MNKLLAIILLGFLFTFNSCRNSERDNDVSTGSSESYWVASNQINSIIREIHNISVGDSILNGIDPANASRPEPCVDSISLNPKTGTFPIDLTITYDTANVCSFERIRSGLLKANFDGKYGDLGTKINISTVNYMVDDYLISAEISMEVIYMVTDTLTFDVWVKNASITDTKAIGNKINFQESHIQFSHNRGRKTITTIDDQFLIVGDGEGIAQNGVVYTFQTEFDNILDHTCAYETFGSVRLKADNQLDRILNFGEGGECDKVMLVTIPPANGDQRVEIK